MTISERSANEDDIKAIKELQDALDRLSEDIDPVRYAVKDIIKKDGLPKEVTGIYPYSMIDLVEALASAANGLSVLDWAIDRYGDPKVAGTVVTRGLSRGLNGLINKLSNQSNPPNGKLNLSDEATKLLKDAIARDPTKRYSSIEDFREHLVKERKKILEMAERMKSPSMEEEAPSHQHTSVPSIPEISPPLTPKEKCVMGLLNDVLKPVLGSDMPSDVQQEARAISDAYNPDAPHRDMQKKLKELLPKAAQKIGDQKINIIVRRLLTSLDDLSRKSEPSGFAL